MIDESILWATAKFQKALLKQSEPLKVTYSKPKMEFVSCELEGEDYVLRMKRPDGQEIHILIPDFTQWDCLRKERSGEPYGLNMVTYGHYI